MSQIDDYASAGTAAVAADLARRAADTASEGVAWVGPRPDHVITRVVRADERIAVEDLEHLADRPREARGVATLRDGASFGTYVNRNRHAGTTMWANVRPVGGGVPTITAVFNDHAGPDEPGWRDHRATLQVQHDEDWAAWLSLSGQMVPQRDFAQFLLDHVHNINPASNPGQLMVAVMKFRAQRKVDYESHVNLTNGEATFAYVEQIGQEKRRGDVKLPDEITVDLYPFAGAVEEGEAFQVRALLRYDTSAELKLGYKLVRPDKVLLQAWDRLAGEVAALVPEVPMLQGVAPEVGDRAS